MWTPLLILPKATCLMTTTQYNSNNSVTPEFKWTFFEKELNWMNSLTYWSRLKKDLWFKLSIGPKVQTGTIQNLCQKLQLIHDPLCFQNLQILLIYYTDPICGLFKAKSIVLKTYSPSSVTLSFHYSILFAEPGNESKVLSVGEIPRCKCYTTPRSQHRITVVINILRTIPVTVLKIYGVDTFMMEQQPLFIFNM